MKIAVSGASGQVGVTLVKELLKEGHSVKVLFFQHKKGLEDLPIECIDGNVLDPQTCNELVAGAEVVFHLAAIVSINGDPTGNVWNVNVNGTRNMLEACVKHKIKKLVHFSSIHAYNTHPVNEPLDETRELAGESAFAYERSKAAGQRLVMEYAEKYELNACTINPTGILGYDDHLPSVKGKMLLDFYNGKIPMLIGGGFNWVDVRDVVKTAIAAMHKGKKGESYLAGGRYLTLTELSQVIGKVTNKKMPKMVAPAWLLRTFLPFISLYGKVTRTEPLYTDESLKSVVEGNKNIVCKKAEEQLGHSVRPIEETIADIYAWFRKEGVIK